jgi:hypothetical protein
VFVNGSLGGNGASITVNSGATLGGNGTLGNSTNHNAAVTINVGGTLAPGATAGAADTINMYGTLTVNGTYKWDLLSSTADTISTLNSNAGAFDRVNLAGGNALSLSSSSSVLQLQLFQTPTTGNAFWNQNEYWHIINGSFTENTATSYFNLLASNVGGSIIGSGSGQELSFSGVGYFGVNYSSNDLVLVWTPVPEPGSLLLGTLAALGLGGFGWRRRRQSQASNATDKSNVKA